MQHGQSGGDLWYTFGRKGARDTRPVVGLIGQVGWFEPKEIALQRLVSPNVVIKRQLNAPGRFLGDQPAFDRLLFRDLNPGVALDDGLAGQGVAGGQILLGQAQGGSAPDSAARLVDPDSAAAAAALAAAGLVQSEAGLLRGIS